MSLVGRLERGQAHFLVIFIGLAVLLAERALSHLAGPWLGNRVNVALQALSHQDVDARVVEPVDEAHEDEHNGVEAELGRGNTLEAAYRFR